MTETPGSPSAIKGTGCPVAPAATQHGYTRTADTSRLSSPASHASTSTPTAEWVKPCDLTADPYSVYEKLRRESPIAWVPSVGKYLVTSYADCHEIELDQERFSAAVSGSGATMAKALGGSPMLRKDDPEHDTERRAINPALRPRSITQVWAPIFEANARTQLDHLRDVGPELAELNRDYAAPVAAQNLIDMLGLPDVSPDQMRRWSHALIAGAGNLLDDRDIWDACSVACTEIDELLDELIAFYSQNPNDSLTSALVNSGLSRTSVSANVKLTISGGMNEPQHMVTNMVWALESHPDQHQQVTADPSLWPSVFDEAVRWLSPIGMYPRETTRPVELGGVALPAGAPIGVVIASANRDESHFTTDPGTFDIFREKQPHLAFGSGVHLCAGHWAAKTSIGRIAVPLLFAEFPTLRVDNRRETTWDGWVFRGLTTLPITW